MKKIEFGYSNDLNPTGSHEGMGIKPGLLLCDADYYGAIEFDGNYYIVAKVIEDEYQRFPQLLNNFIVRKALCDLYPDGSCTLMLDQNEDNITHQLENYLNDEEIKQHIETPDDLFKVFNSNIHRAPVSFMLAELNRDTILSTSITSEAFEIKNEAIKNCHDSFSSLQIQLSDKYTR